MNGSPILRVGRQALSFFWVLALWIITAAVVGCGGGGSSSMNTSASTGTITVSISDPPSCEVVWPDG